MRIQTYTDDGYIDVDLEHVAEEIDVTALIELLYNNLVLSVDDVNKLLPAGFEVVV